jgi:hypothetical protein
MKGKEELEKALKRYLTPINYNESAEGSSGT